MKFILPIILIAVAASGVYWYVNPEYVIIKKLLQERDQYQAAVVQAQQASEKLNKLVLEWNSYSVKDLERLEKVLPENIDSIRLLLNFQTLAKRFGLKAEGIQVRPAPAATDKNQQAATAIQSATVSFGVNTTYEGFQTFLEELEKSLQIATVESLSLSAPEDKTGKRTYQITFSTYMLQK